jgi:hypothetical protein
VTFDSEMKQAGYRTVLRPAVSTDNNNIADERNFKVGMSLVSIIYYRVLHPVARNIKL